MFENIWMDDEKIGCITKDNWNLFPSKDPRLKLHSTLERLWYWGKDKFGFPTKKLDSLNVTLKSLQESNQNNRNYNYMVEVQSNIDNLLYQEEVWRAQHAKIH